MLDGSVSVKQSRDMRIEDLCAVLVQTAISAVDVLLRGKRVLVTGGGGRVESGEVERRRGGEAERVRRGEEGMMAKIESVRELEVYKMAFEAAMRIFCLTKNFPAEERFSLTGQIRRASRSYAPIYLRDGASDAIRRSLSTSSPTGDARGLRNPDLA